MFRIFCLGALVFSFGSVNAAMTHWMATQRIRALRFDGGKLVVNGKCEKILVAADMRFGKPIPLKVIKEMLPSVLKGTGEKLEFPSRASSGTPRYARYVGTYCFTKSMRITTGTLTQVEIGTLRAGDAVLSLDLQSRRVVTNYIKRVIVTEGQTYGVLTSPKLPLEVTSRERFYSRPDTGGSWGFRAIADLNSEAALAWSEPREGEVCRLLPVRRGIYEADRGSATVFNLELTGEPRNFFVEGFLVHNMKP